MERLKFKDKNALNFTDAIEIDPQRAVYLSHMLDRMVNLASTGIIRIVHMADIIGFIEDYCETEEERVWCIVNHIQWLARNNRLIPPP